MSTQVRENHTALPPPTRHLLHRERPIGWLEGNTLGFFGFADVRDAANAAWVAYRTVSRKLARALGTRPTPIDIEPLSIESRNGLDVIAASGRPIALLVRPGHAWTNGSDWFGFAIEVPPVVRAHEMPGIMRAASRALLKSGLAWSMLRSRPRHRGDELFWNPLPTTAKLPSRHSDRRVAVGTRGEHRRRQQQHGHFAGTDDSFCDTTKNEPAQSAFAARAHRDHVDREFAHRGHDCARDIVAEHDSGYRLDRSPVEAIGG